MAAHVAEILTTSGPVVALGHSLGGVVALALSSGWFGTRVTGVVGLGIKVAWTADELGTGAAAAFGVGAPDLPGLLPPLIAALVR